MGLSFGLLDRLHALHALGDFRTADVIHFLEEHGVVTRRTMLPCQIAPFLLQRRPIAKSQRCECKHTLIDFSSFSHVSRLLSSAHFETYERIGAKHKCNCSIEIIGLCYPTKSQPKRKRKELREKILLASPIELLTNVSRLRGKLSVNCITNNECKQK